MRRSRTTTTRGVRAEGGMVAAACSVSNSPSFDCAKTYQSPARHRDLSACRIAAAWTGNYAQRSRCVPSPIMRLAGVPQRKYPKNTEQDCGDSGCSGRREGWSPPPAPVLLHLISYATVVPGKYNSKAAMRSVPTGVYDGSGPTGGLIDYGNFRNVAEISPEGAPPATRRLDCRRKET